MSFTYILVIFLPGLYVPFDFPLGIFRWTARFSEIQHWTADFLETFSVNNFVTIFPRFEIFVDFAQWKEPYISKIFAQNNIWSSSDLLGMYVPLQIPFFLFYLSDQYFSCFPAAPGAHVTAAGQDLPHGVEERVGWLWNTTDRTSVYKGEHLYTFHTC